MGTRSDIIAKLSDGTFARIYCHWDGYPSHNGRILLENYRDQDKIEELMALGSLSSLGPEVGVKHSLKEPYEFGTRARDEWVAKFGDMCNAYHRDGEDELNITKGATLADVWPEPETTWTEFTYVWDGQSWYVSDSSDSSVAPTLTQSMELLWKVI